MGFLYLMTSVLFALGLFYILTDFIIVPTGKAKKAVLLLKKESVSFSEQLTVPIANKIQKFIAMDKIKADSLKKKLNFVGIDFTPEFFTAKAYAEALLITLLGIPMWIFSPIFTLMCIVLAVIVYFKEFQTLNDKIKKKSDKIEKELVLFSSTIKQALSNSRDVMQIFNTYKKVCGPELMYELDVTLSDMRTGSYEAALRRFDGRVSSPGLSDIIRGLQAVLRGDDQQAYFEMLTHDLMVKEKENLKRQALNRPGKLKGTSYLLMFCFVAIYMYAIGYQIVSNMKIMF